MMEETEPAPRPRGRPKTGRKDYDKIRTAGRQPEPLWAACVAQAEADGESLSAFTTEAWTRELARRQRRDARKQTPLGQAPQHVTR